MQQIKLTRTICPYCGCGCQLIVKTKNNNVTEIIQDKKDPVSEGKPCIKGLKSYEILNSRQRITQPLIRKKGKLTPATWEQAYKLIRKKLNPKNTVFYGASPASNEDNYLLQKFARDLGSENIDSSARLCHAATCYAFNKAFGITAMPAKINDFKKADCILIIGTNPKATYPVAFNKILQAKKSGARIICVRDWKDETSKFADIFVCIEEGTQLAFINCILNHIKEKNKLPKNIQASLKKCTLSCTSKICECSKEDIKKVIREIQKSKNLVIEFGMGLTQHIYGVNNILGLINLAIAKNAKPISMRGKTNIQGVGDMGCLPKHCGNTLISSIFLKPQKALYIIGSSPAQSMPDLNKVHKQLKKMFIVQQTVFPNLTTKFADVILPSVTWLEYSGSFTNAESRVRTFNKAIKPIAGKPHWKIIQELSGYFNLNYDYKTEKQIQKEIKNKIPGYKNITFNGNFVQRPIKFRKYHKADFTKLEQRTSKKYPFVLTTERWPFQFCSGEISGHSITLNTLSKEALCFINSEDARKLKLKQNSKIKISSKAGQIKVKVKITQDMPENLVSVPFHFKEVLVNKLFPLEFDPAVQQPNQKRVAVSIKKVL